MSDEARARISAAQRGVKKSAGFGAKVSAATRGKAKPAGFGAKVSATLKGRTPSDADRKAVGEANARRVWPAESLANLSVLHTGQHPSEETRAKLSAWYRPRGTLSLNWKGGPKVFGAKQRAKRRLMGFDPLNSWFLGCEGHHVDNEQVIYMPRGLHRSVYHRQHDGRGMAEINALAYSFLFMQGQLGAV